MRGFGLVAALAALGLSAPAAAAIGTSYAGGRFAVDIGSIGVGFVTNLSEGGTGARTVEPGDLLSCTAPTGSVCAQQQFFDDSSNFTAGNDIFDVVGFGYDPGNCCQYIYIYFPNGAFYNRGSYQSLSGGPLATLDVGGVPEPDNWLLLIAGFGLIGTALRTRRPATA